MKISHKDLEACRLSPKSWVEAQRSSGGARRLSYGRALGLAICEFHKTNSIGAASAKIDKYVAKNFTNQKRITKLYQNLDEYAKWFAGSGIISADSNVLLAFPGDQNWQLGGYISRIDSLASGYRAVLFEGITSDWKDQLRMPLIQTAVAQLYGRPASEVRVGIQEIDGNALADIRYQKAERDSALAEFMGIGVRVYKLWPKVKP
jgi:hypothetical protein